MKTTSLPAPTAEETFATSYAEASAQIARMQSSLDEMRAAFEANPADLLFIGGANAVAAYARKANEAIEVMKGRRSPR